jgi:hypothetical protein
VFCGLSKYYPASSTAPCVFNVFDIIWFGYGYYSWLNPYPWILASPQGGAQSAFERAFSDGLSTRAARKGLYVSFRSQISP